MYTYMYMVAPIALAAFCTLKRVSIRGHVAAVCLGGLAGVLVSYLLRADAMSINGDSDHVGAAGIAVALNVIILIELCMMPRKLGGLGLVILTVAQAGQSHVEFLAAA